MFESWDQSNCDKMKKIPNKWNAMKKKKLIIKKQRQKLESQGGGGGEGEAEGEEGNKIWTFSLDGQRGKTRRRCRAMEGRGQNVVLYDWEGRDDVSQTLTIENTRFTGEQTANE